MRRFPVVLSLMIVIPSLLMAEDAQMPALISNITLDRQEAYLNEQVLVTVELKVRYDVFGVTQSPFATELGSVLSVHKTDFKETISATEYRTTRKTYALFPSEAGTHELPAVAAYAQISATAAGNTTGRNQKVKVETDEISLTVKQPPHSEAVWLPAAEITLTREWIGHDNGTDLIMTKGEPSKQRITINITGQHPAAIPDITPASSPHWRFYYELPKWDMQISPVGLTGTLTREISVVPMTAEETTLPGFSVQWWDINQKRWRQSQLAEKSIYIADTANVQNQYKLRNRLGWGVAGLLVISCLTYGIRQWLVKPTEHRAWKKVLRHLRKQDPAALKHAIKEWQVYLPLSLDELKSVTCDLNETLYDREAKPLNWQHLRVELNTARHTGKQKHKRKNKKPPDLVSLY